MSINEVFMPALSSTMTEGKIVAWLKSPGDKVEKGETVVVVESDKADMDVESFYEGFLAHIIVPAGETAPVGSAIAYVVETEAEIVTAKSLAGLSGAVATNTSSSSPTPLTTTDETTDVVAEPVAVSQNGAQHREGRVVVSPRARKLAKELKVDLNSLQGSGPYGRIIAEDVEASVGKVSQPHTPIHTPTFISTQLSTQLSTQPQTTSTALKPTTTPVPVISGATSSQTVPFTTFQNAVVRNMVASLAVPVFRVSYKITTDELDKIYKQIKSKGVTMTALLAKAVAVTLQKHRLLNASYSDQGIVHHPQINVAVAVAMDDGGLITPVLQNADKVDIYSLSRNWKSLVERAKAKQLQPEEYNSGTFTISNLGMFGVEIFDAILPPGQGSILAIGASRPQVVATDEGLLGVRQQMEVNITSDHRIIYGADAAAFLRDLAKLIQTNPGSLTL